MRVMKLARGTEASFSGTSSGRHAGIGGGGFDDGELSSALSCSINTSTFPTSRSGPFFYNRPNVRVLSAGNSPGGPANADEVMRHEPAVLMVQ